MPVVGRGGKGGKGGNGGKGGKGGKGQAASAPVAPSPAEGLAASNATLVKAFADNQAAFAVFEHEKLEGALCADVRDLARRLLAQGWKPYI